MSDWESAPVVETQDRPAWESAPPVETETQDVPTLPTQQITPPEQTFAPGSPREIARQQASPYLPEAITSDQPLLKGEQLSYTEGESAVTRGLKAAQNVVNKFGETLTRPSSIAGILIPPLGLTQAAIGIAQQPGEIKRAFTETPPGSPQRAEAVAGGALSLGMLLFGAKGLREGLRAPEPTITEPTLTQTLGFEKPAEPILPTAEEITKGIPNAVQKPETTQPNGMRAELQVPQETVPPATSVGGEGVPEVRQEQEVSGGAPQEPVAPVTPTEETPTVTGEVAPQGQATAELATAAAESPKETPELPKPDEAPTDFGKRLVEEVQPPQTPRFTAARGKATALKTTIEETTGIRPDPTAVREQLSNSITRAQALSEYLRGQEKGSQVGAETATSDVTKTLQVMDKWLAGDQERVRQDMTEFVNKTLPPDERGRFIGAISRALSRAPIKGDPTVIYRHAFRVMQAIQNRSEVVYKDNLINEIKNTVSKSAESPSIDVAYRRNLKEIMSQFSVSKPTPSTLSKLQSLQDFVNREKAAGREPGVPQEQLDQITRLHQLPLKDMDVNSLERLRDDVSTTASLGKLKANLLEAVWNKRKSNMVSDMQKAPSSPIESRPENIPQPTERLTVGEKFMNGVRRSLNSAQTLQDAIAPMDEIYDRLGNGKGSYSSFPSRQIKGNLDLAENSKLAELVPIRDASTALVKQWGLQKSDMETVGLKGIINMIGRERLEAMGVRPDIIDRVESIPLTKGQQSYYDFTRQHYDALGSRVQDVAHKLYQQDMEVVPNYVPLLRDWASFSEGKATEPLVDPLGSEVPFNETATMDQLRRDFNPKIISRTEQGFLKSRLEGAKSPVQLNAEQVFLRHTQDALHFIHQQPILKMLGEVARSPEFQAKYGKVGQNIVLDNLDTVASQGYVNHNQRIPLLDWIRNSTSKGAVGFRIASNIVHSSQIGFEATHAGGPGWWSKGLQVALTPEGQAFLRKNAAETYFRSGGEPAQADVEMMSKVGKAGFFVARNIDKLGAQATFLGRYMKEMSKSGIPVDDILNAPVNPDLQALALQRMHRAVASPMGKDIPQMTSRGKALGGNVSVARAVNQFRNIFLDNWSNIRHDFLRVGTKQAGEVIKSLQDGEIAAGAKQAGDAASHRAAIAAAALIGVAMETGIKMGVKSGTQTVMSKATGVTPPARKDESTYLQELEHHLLNRIPFVGQVSSAFLYGETGIPVIDSVVNPIKETGQAFYYSKKPETTAKHLIRAASSAATVAGIPGSSQAIELAQPKATQLLGKALPDRSKPRRGTNVSSVYNP